MWRLKSHHLIFNQWAVLPPGRHAHVVLSSSAKLSERVEAFSGLCLAPLVCLRFLAVTESEEYVSPPEHL